MNDIQRVFFGNTIISSENETVRNSWLLIFFGSLPASICHSSKKNFHNKEQHLKNKSINENKFMNSKRPSIVQCQDVFSEIYKQISREENLLLSPKGNIEVRIFNNLQNKPSLLFKQALSSSFFGCQISPTELQQKQKAKKVLKKISKQL